MGDDVTQDVEDALILSDLVSRVLDRGVTVMGDVVISVAGVDLIRLGLRLDLIAVETLEHWSRRLAAAEASRALPPRKGG
jgi:hypothetical protein